MFSCFYRQWAELNVGILLKLLLHMEQMKCPNKHLIPLDVSISISVLT